MLKEINNKEWRVTPRHFIGVENGCCIRDYVDTFCGIKPEDVERFNNGEDVPMYVCCQYGDEIVDFVDCFDVVEVDMKPKFLNISNHALNKEQLDSIQNIFGDFILVELPDELKDLWGNLTPQNYSDVIVKIKVFMFENHIFNAHLAGFMPAVHELLGWGDVRRNFYYSFSVRESVEEVVNGATIKKSVFRHKGWYRY